MEARVFLLFWFAVLSQAQLRSCFDVDGTQSLDFPCNPGSNVSSCCLSGGRCATNLYCVSPRGAQIVGTCTDRTFTDPACPWPLGKAKASLNFDHFDYKLNTTTCSDGTICPSQSDPDCCSAGRGKVEINFRNNAVIPSASRDLVSYYSDAGYTIAVTTSATATGTPISRNTAAPSLTSSPTTTSSRSSSRASSIPVSASTTSSTATSTNNAGGLSTGAKVGIGVGVGLVVLAIALLVLFLLRRSKPRRNADPQSSPRESQGMIPDDELRAEQALASELPAGRTYPPIAEMEAQDNRRKIWNVPSGVAQQMHDTNRVGPAKPGEIW